MVRKTYYISPEEELMLDVWNTPADIESQDFRRLLSSNVNLGGKASIVIFLYSTNNRESFAKVSDDYFTKENVLNLIDDNPTVFLVANDMDAPVREDKGEKMEAAI